MKTFLLDIWFNVLLFKNWGDKPDSATYVYGVLIWIGLVGFLFRLYFAVVYKV